jgi:hypothetical protein
MSLADDLQAQYDASRALTTDEWFVRYRESLSKEDKTTLDAWISDPRKPSGVIFKVMKLHGYPGAASTFRGWLSLQRGTR